MSQLLGEDVVFRDNVAAASHSDWGGGAIYAVTGVLTVRRSTFIDKDSHEHFEVRTHNRLIDVLDPDSKTIDMLMRLNLPAGVDIEIKI